MPLPVDRISMPDMARQQQNDEPKYTFWQVSLGHGTAFLGFKVVSLDFYDLVFKAECHTTRHRLLGPLISECLSTLPDLVT